MAGLTCVAAELCGPCRTELQNAAFFGLGHCSLILLDDISQDTNFLKGDFLIRSVDVVVFAWPISGVLVLWVEESKEMEGVTMAAGTAGLRESLGKPLEAASSPGHMSSEVGMISFFFARNSLQCLCHFLRLQSDCSSGKLTWITVFHPETLVRCPCTPARPATHVFSHLR